MAADPQRVWDLLMTMSGPDDRLWPPGIPALRFDGPLAVGTHGAHGPIHYEVIAVDPDAGTLMFRFRKPTGLVGHHAFRVSPDGRAGTLLRHEVVANPQGWMRLKWPLFVRWAHDEVVEQVLDQAELALGYFPSPPGQRSRWVASVLARGMRRPRAVPVPVSSSACEALTRVDWADAYRMALRPDSPQDLETWRQVISDLSRRSRLLQLRLAGGRVLRSWTGAPERGPDGPFRRYMAVIKPLHRRPVPSYMNRAALATTPTITPDISAPYSAPDQARGLPT